MIKQKIKQVALRDKYDDKWNVEPALVDKYELPRVVQNKRTYSLSMMTGIVAQAMPLSHFGYRLH